MRVNYQAATWKSSLISNPYATSPGCILAADGKLGIQWVADSPAPSVILEFISCKCNRKCQLPICECMVSGLNCTDECKQQNCTNIADVHNDSEDLGEGNPVVNDESSESEKEYDP